MLLGEIFLDFQKSLDFATERWVEILHPGRAKTLIIDQVDVQWMLRASAIDSFRNGWYGTFRDEYHKTCEKYRDKLLALLGTTEKWFVRTEQYSIKYSGYSGPITGLDIERLIKALVKHVRGHSGVNPFFDEGKDKVIYFLPWLEMDPDKEFRYLLKTIK